jgi:hypothetical protein
MIYRPSFVFSLLETWCWIEVFSSFRNGSAQLHIPGSRKCTQQEGTPGLMLS